MKYVENYIKGAPVYIALSFEAGGMYQGAHSQGMAHLVEHILAARAKTGAPLYAETDYRYITFFTQDISHTKQGTHEALGFLCKKITDYLDQTEVPGVLIEREQRVIANELSNFSFDYPNTNKTVLHDYLFTGEQPQSDYELISGNTNGTNNFSGEEVAKFISFAISRPSLLIITGDFAINDIKEVIDTHFPGSHEKSPQDAALINLRHDINSGSKLADPSKATTIDQTFLGIGWSIRNPSHEDTATALVGIKALANTENDLYASLREGDSSIYYFESDTSFARSQLNISLHTSYMASTDSGQMTDTIMNFLEDEVKVKDAIRRQIELEKAMLPALFDGSKTIYSNQYYFSHYNIDLEEYGDLISSSDLDTMTQKFLEFIKPSRATTLRS